MDHAHLQTGFTRPNAKRLAGFVITTRCTPIDDCDHEQWTTFDDKLVSQDRTRDKSEQLTHRLTHTPSLSKRLTLTWRHTQSSTNDMRTMTPRNPPLTNVTIDDTTDPQTNGAIVQPIAAICVREVYDQSVLQFTINHKVCFALPRYTSRVIHRSKF